LNSIPCPQGNYCPIESKKEVPCPEGTYSDAFALVTEQECRPCPSGYACNKKGILTFEGFDCPTGSYCPGKAAEVLCPSGTYRNATGATSYEDCETCPLGFYCKIGTVQPVICYDGTYCPEGTPTYLTVPGGYYSNVETKF
jgi:hypothetical protein